MRSAFNFIMATIFLLSCASTQSQPADSPTPKAITQNDLSPEQIIQKFIEKETKNYDSWMRYMYKQTVVIRIVSIDGVQSKETMAMVFQAVFDDAGNRKVELVSRSGQLRSLNFTQEDLDMIINPLSFLTAKDLPLYTIKHIGREKLNALDCHVFSVKPKDLKKGQIYFKGKIWVDALDPQIVRTVGIVTPQSTSNRFPELETIRQAVDGKYWFPITARADSNLHYPYSGPTIRIEETITYADYKINDFKTPGYLVSPAPAEQGSSIK